MQWVFFLWIAELSECRSPKGDIPASLTQNMKNKSLPPENPKIPLICDVQKYKKYSRSEISIPDYINPELAYLAGALRDGTISKTETRIGTKYYIAYCNTSYSWLRNVIKPLIEKTFQIQIGEPLIDRKPTKFQIRTKKHGLVIYLADLFGHPFGKQSNWKTPPWILNAPKGIKKWYIRGFFDSEGGCGNVIKQRKKYPWQSTFFIGFYASSPGNTCHVLNDISKLLSEFNIESKPTEKEKHSWKKRTVYLYKTKQNCFLLRIRDPKEKMKFIKRIGSSHPEKYSNLLELSKLIAAQS